MTNHIAWLLEVDINNSEADGAKTFKTLMAEMITATKSETGTLAYEWHFDEADSKCAIYERYADDAAVMTHLASFGNFAERFLSAVTPTRFAVYGDPAPETRDALAGFSPKYWTQDAGFDRFPG